MVNMSIKPQEFVQKKQPSDAAVQAAKQNPGGWVYQVDEEYATNQAVPPEAIRGAWQVDLTGNIVGEFIPNPNYKPKFFENTSNNKE